MNPYLHAPQGSGGGYQAAPGGYFGASRGTGVWSPSPQAYFGNAMGAQHCPPARMDPAAIARIAPYLRHPLGQWPGMPPLNPGAQQQAAGCVVCASQTHADSLVTIYGVDSGAAPLIGIGLTATVTVTPQKRHIPEKLVMSEAMASTFLITGIFAGVEPVLATTGPISAAIFVQDSTAAQFKSVIMDVGMDFSVGVTNISGATARFTTTVIGKPVPPGL